MSLFRDKLFIAGIITAIVALYFDSAPLGFSAGCLVTTAYRDDVRRKIDEMLNKENK